MNINEDDLSDLSSMLGILRDNSEPDPYGRWPLELFREMVEDFVQRRRQAAKRKEQEEL